jgi:phage terminase large subunit
MDYGLDMLAGYWAAFDPDGRCLVYREVYESGLVIRDAAEKILSFGDDVYAYLAPSDLWGRTADTGKSRAELFGDAGLPLTRVNAAGRVDGWMHLREWMRPRKAPGEDARPGLLIFSTCQNLIRTLPALLHDARRPEDCATEPHELTHAPMRCATCCPAPLPPKIRARARGLQLFVRAPPPRPRRPRRQGPGGLAAPFEDRRLKNTAAPRFPERQKRPRPAKISGPRLHA